MKISVLTPSYNSAKYLERAIASVLRQDYTNWEHVIIDGGSSDATIRVLNMYPHLIWESKSDRGQSDAMNQAFEKSSGDLIVYLNADDELEEGAFSFVVAKFLMCPHVDMIVGNLRVNRLGYIEDNKPSILLGSILRYDKFTFPLNPVSYVYRRTLQIQIGPFPINNHFTMDYWFLLRAFLFGRVIKVDRIFGTFYFDGNNKSADGDRAIRQLKEVRNDFLKSFFFRPHVFYYMIKNFFLNS